MAVEQITLKQLIIWNFQSHKETRVNFGPGVNAIIGQSDSGKTAILRALYWVLLNVPQGDDYRSDWGGDTEVTIKLSNGTRITRRKTASKNQYMLQERGEEEMIFTSFGREVPDEIQRAHNISDRNIQQQLDPPFMLCETEGEVAKILNQVADLSIIDTSLSRADAKVRECMADIKATGESLEGAYETLERFPDMSHLEQGLNDLEDASKALEGDMRAVVSLRGLIAKGPRIACMASEASKVLVHAPDVDRLTQALEAYEEAVQEAAKLLKVLERIEKGEKYISRLKPQVKCAEEVKDLTERHKHWEIERDKCAKLSDFLTSHAKAEARAQKATKARKTAVEALKEHMPDECPLCGRTD